MRMMGGVLAAWVLGATIASGVTPDDAKQHSDDVRYWVDKATDTDLRIHLSTLEAMGPAAIEQLSKIALEEKDPKARQGAARLLGSLGEVGGSALVGVLNDPAVKGDPATLVVLLEGISVFSGDGWKPLSPVLIEATRGQDEKVVDAAIVALGKMRLATPERAVRMIEILKQAPRSSRHAYLAANALKNATMLERRSCREDLATLVSEGKCVQEVLEVLRSMGADGVPVRQKILDFIMANNERGGNDLHLATLVLGDMGAGAADCWSVLLLNRKYSRDTILQAICAAGQRAAAVAPALVKLLDEGDPVIKSRLLEALSALGPYAEEALPKLEKMGAEAKRTIDSIRLSDKVYPAPVWNPAKVKAVPAAKADAGAEKALQEALKECEPFATQITKGALFPKEANVRITRGYAVLGDMAGLARAHQKWQEFGREMEHYSAAVESALRAGDAKGALEREQQLLYRALTARYLGAESTAYSTLAVARFHAADLKGAAEAVARLEDPLTRNFALYEIAVGLWERGEIAAAAEALIAIGPRGTEAGYDNPAEKATWLLADAAAALECRGDKAGAKAAWQAVVRRASSYGGNPILVKRGLMALLRLGDEVAALERVRFSGDMNRSELAQWLAAKLTQKGKADLARQAQELAKGRSDGFVRPPVTDPVYAAIEKQDFATAMRAASAIKESQSRSQSLRAIARAQLEALDLNGALQSLAAADAAVPPANRMGDDLTGPEGRNGLYTGIARTAALGGKKDIVTRAVAQLPRPIPLQPASEIAMACWVGGDSASVNTILSPAMSAPRNGTTHPSTTELAYLALWKSGQGATISKVAGSLLSGTSTGGGNAQANREQFYEKVLAAQWMACAGDYNRALTWAKAQTDPEQRKQALVAVVRGLTDRVSGHSFYPHGRLEH